MSRLSDHGDAAAFLFTVAPDEPSEWADEIEEMRDSLLGLGRPVEEVQHQLAVRLLELRGPALPDYDDSDIPDPRAPSPAEDPPQPRLVVETWDEFRDQSPEEIDYLVQGLVPTGSLVFVAGAPKAGKTWIGFGLGISVASGTAFLGRFPVPVAKPVLYFALEGHRAAIRARIGSITRGMGKTPEKGGDLGNLSITYRPIGLDLADGTWAHDVIAACEKGNVGMVIVDVLRAAAPTLRESGDGAGDFARIRAGLAPLLAAGVTIVLLHHFIKAGETSKARTIGERMSGSGALFGHADLVLGITGKDPRNMRIELMSRDSAAPDPFGVTLEGNGSSEFGGFGYRDTLYMRATDDAPPEGGSWEKLDAIAEWMEKQQGRISPKRIREMFDTTNPTLHRYRSELESRGVYHYEDGRLSGYEFHPSTPPWRGNGEVSEMTPPPLHPRSGSGGVRVSDGEVGEQTPEIWEDEL